MVSIKFIYLNEKMSLLEGVRQGGPADVTEPPQPLQAHSHTLGFVKFRVRAKG